MPKMTAKYSGAVQVAGRAGVSTACDQETLYSRLGEKGWQWDSRRQVWEDTGAVPANAPTPDVMLRVWAAGDRVEGVAQDAINALMMLGYEMVEKSGPYPCRPPQQKESRVYLRFRVHHNSGS